VVLFLACYVVVPLLASASPPDPVWIPGIYDLADYDDVVVALGDLDAVDDSSPARLIPVDARRRPLPSTPAFVLCISSCLSHQPRSPPSI